MHRHARWLLVPLLSLTLLAATGPGSSAATGVAAPTPAAPGVAPAAMRQAFADRLAANLGGGITGAQVLAAMDTLRRSPPAQGGYLTAMAAALHVSPDRLAAAFMATRMEGGWHVRRMHHGGLLRAAAAYLGMSEEAVQAELAKGRSLAQVARAAGKTSKGLEEALTAAARQRIHEMVGRSWAPRPMAPAAPGTPATT